MDSNRINKFLYPTLICLFVVSFLSPVQANSYTIEVKGIDSLSEKASSKFRDIISKSEVVWGDVADVDVEELLGADTLYCSFDNNQSELFANYKSENFSYHYTRYESFDLEAQARVSVYEDYVHIDFHTAKGTYRAISISETELAVIRYETAILEEIDDAVQCDDITSDDMVSISDKLTLRTTPIIRVLFLYTPSAMLMMSGSNQVQAMKEEANRYISEGNESFANSNINAQLQLAYLGPTIFDESLHTWDSVLSYFRGTSDAYMNEVHTLRNKYKADLCLLMIEKNIYCGKAYLNANDNTAFGVVRVNADSCTRRYSPIHEIGHLLGCHHDMIHDSVSPYQYGHGYINCVPGKSWSTIMSYESSCAYINHRILYWSNPYVYYKNVATGTTTYENNARVWNERAGTVAAFRQNSNVISYTSLDNNSDAIFEDVEASIQITTGGGYEVQNGQTVQMNAGTGIRLTANTHIKSGANFRASTGSYISSLPMRLNEEEAEEPEPFDLPASIEIYPSEEDNLPSNGDGKTYNLFGQPVDETYHGIVIQNGQKRVQ